jgi:L,D-transpeptidase ErfK/SrfK
MIRPRLLAAALLLGILACPSGSWARSYPLEPDQAAVGRVLSYTTRQQDTLLDIARTYDLGYTELVIANPGIDPWLPGAGKTVTIPAFFLLPDAPRQGIVVNLVKQRFYYYPPGGKTVETYPLGVGGEGRNTPLGVTRIVRKQAHPTWYPPPSILADEPDLPKIVPPGPDNPMGDYALYLGWPTYAMHGTDKPYGVGRNVSHGCLRLYPEDIEQLFREVPVGTKVQVINEDAEWAWIGDDLYLSVFPTKEQTDEIDIGHKVAPMPPAGLKDRLIQAVGDRAERIVWVLADEVARERSGIPTQITFPVSGAGRADQ